MKNYLATRKKKSHLAHTILSWNLHRKSLNRASIRRKSWKEIFPQPHFWAFKQLLSLVKSINRSKFSIIPSTQNIGYAYAAKVRLTNMSVLLVMNTPYSRTMSVSGCYICTWTNVEHFTQCIRCYQGIYVVDTRQLLCTSMNSCIRAMHDRNIQLSRKGISQKTITPSPSLWRRFHLHKGNITNAF